MYLKGWIFGVDGLTQDDAFVIGGFEAFEYIAVTGVEDEDFAPFDEGTFVNTFDNYE